MRMFTPCGDFRISMFNIRKALMYSAVPFAIAEATRQLPIVNVRLGPPTNPQPQVSAEILLLESARKAAETAQMQELDLAYQHAANHVSFALSGVIASALGSSPKPSIHKSTSLLEIRDGLEVRDDVASQSFAVDVRPLQQPDVAIKAKLDQIEQTRSADEKHIFEQALDEFAALESIFTSEVLAQLHARANGDGSHRVAGFLQAVKDVARLGSVESVRGLNVRLSASAEPFPTIERLALAMEGRRDASEDVIRNRILELELQFFEVANHVLRDALHVHVSGAA